MLLKEPSEDFAEEIHQRLLARDDPTTASKLATAYLEVLVKRLRSKPRFGEIHDETLFYDAAADAILNYAENPASFEPCKSKLLTYLINSAEGDLLNALAKEKRKSKGRGRAVEQLTLDLSQSLESDEITIIEEGTTQKLMQQVLQEFPDPLDRQLLPLILDGERKTSAYAEILRIQDRDDVEQQRIVKQYKDRIKVRLKRLGGKINE